MTFEMRLLDTEDVHTAWASVARKIGVKICPRSPGKITHRHIYLDKDGLPYHQVRRYEDGSARYYRSEGVFWRAGLRKRKRILYNLPDVIAADLVIIVEGEKKADILSKLPLLDSDGKRVAVTTTGGANTWRSEFAEDLIGKRVLFLPDSDDPGQQYAENVQATLTRAGIEYSLVDFSDYGNDFREFLEVNTPETFVDYIGMPWLKLPETRPDGDRGITI